MSKFKMGQMVRCFREETSSQIGFDFHGKILKISDTGDSIEYRVENAPELWEGLPILIWEHEMEGV